MTGAPDVPVASPDEHPGWELSPRTLLFLVPGLAHLALRGRRSRVDPLSLLRQLWLSFSVAVLLFGYVVVVSTRGSRTRPAGVWVAALAVATALCLAMSERAGRRPLDCCDLSSLSASYRTCFFLRTALSEAIVLLAFAATFIVGQWWIYWLFLPFTLFGFGRNAPTVRHLAAAQDRLRRSGCNLSLVRALRGVAPG